MAQFAVLIAGLLFLVESQSSDVADLSTHQGFLSKFVTPNLNHVKHGKKADALASSNNVYDKDEEKSAEKMFAEGNSNTPATLSVIGFQIPVGPPWNSRDDSSRFVHVLPSDKNTP